MRRKCLDCPAIIGEGSRCRACALRYRSGYSRSTLPRAVKARDGWRCRRCGSPDHLTMHHVVPLARGGTDAPTNLETLCHRCHEVAHHGQADR